RTGREALASSGSHCSAASLQQPPVSEQAWLAARDASQPLSCAAPMAAQGLEFPMRPSRQDAVDVAQGRVESRLVVSPGVVDPPGDGGVKHPGQTVQRLAAASVKRPASHRLPDRFESLVAAAGLNKTPKVPPPPRQPRPEGVAEEVELLVGIVSAPVIILAVD